MRVQLTARYIKGKRKREREKTKKIESHWDSERDEKVRVDL